MKGVSLKSLKAELDELKATSVRPPEFMPTEDSTQELRAELKRLQSVVLALAKHKAFELQRVSRHTIGHFTDREVDDVQRTIVEYVRADDARVEALREEQERKAREAMAKAKADGTVD